VKKRRLRSFPTKTWGLSVLCSSLLWIARPAIAQQPAPRINTQIDNSERTRIPGTQPVPARLANDLGKVSPGVVLHGITIVFGRTAAQQAALEALIAAQQNPSSPSYHKWLTPDQFAARFGVNDSDIAKLSAWLRQQGFTVDQVSRGRNRLAVTGTAGQVQSAFGAELHYYRIRGNREYAPSSDLTVPAALTGVIETITNVSTIRPRSHVRFRKHFTSAQSGDHYMTPGDVATVYDIKAAYSAGYTAAGQSIAVVGQSEVSVSDVENFQNAAGLTVKDPTLVLVPDSGSAEVYTGDEAESDLDLEYSGAIATGATMYFVYVGSNSNYSVWDAIDYAVQTRIAPIISSSYGICETELSSTDYAELNEVLAQATTQGQTVIAAAGDDGSTDCFGYTDLTTTQQEALVVDFPSSSQYVTGMGGTEFPSADVAASNTTYWESANGSDVISSARSYIPEQVWNDDSLLAGESSVTELSSGGGGVSTLTARPSWQTGVTGITSGNYRLVPDLALDASPNNAGYLFCSSDSSATGITGSCADGFRDSSDEDLTVAGGTSFDAPIFSGLTAILNQKAVSTGQGVINTTLYSLAASSGTYASLFHDITSGGNQCEAGSTYCSSAGESEYTATTGYDEASGLGSIDFYNLLNAWPVTSSLTPSITAASAATTSPASGQNDTITIAVTSGASSVSSTPTGTLTVLVDGTTQTSSLALSTGSASYTFSSTTAGAHVITVNYSGDSNFAASTGSSVVSVGSAAASFSLAATSLTVSPGSSGTSTVTITPNNGYTGTIGWSVASSPTLTNGCFAISNTAVTGTSPISIALTIYTSASACSSAAFTGTKGKQSFLRSTTTGPDETYATLRAAETLFAGGMAAFLLAAVGRRRAPRSYAYLAVLMMAALGLGPVACGSGSSSSSSSSTNVAAGTYTLTLTGTDSASASITATATMTLTVE
jgi:Pro-kumamolisin, activation domain/Bacterial Ig-like domain (group 3)